MTHLDFRNRLGTAGSVRPSGPTGPVRPPGPAKPPRARSALAMVCLAVLALAGSVLGPSALAAPAYAASGRLTLVPSTHTPLPGLPGFGAIVADDAAHSVFVSTGAAGNSVEEIGYDGTVEAALDHEFGADGMVLSADRATLYVALATGDAVAAIDTGSFTEKARYPVPAHTCPTTLARTGPDVWIGYGCGDAWTGGVGVLATDAASPRIALDRQDATTDVHYSTAPLLAAAGGASGTGTLVVSQPYLSPTNVATYRTTAGPAPALALAQSAPRGGSDLADLAVSKDGATAFAASGSQTTVDAFTTAALADAGQYRTGLGPDALALSPDGTELAATTSIPDSHVYVWKLGSSMPVGDYWMPLTGAPAPGGLAYSGDGKLLFLVTNAPSGEGGPTLVVLNIA